MSDAKEIQKALQANFTQAQVSWKPQTVKDGKALAVAYIDARDVMSRLDDVVGCDKWYATFNQVGDKSVECHLYVKFGDEWICKSDVGGTSDQPEEDNRVKAGYSDALKRAAIHWGIGRSIYQLPMSWVPAEGKRLAQEPKLPLWYIQGHQAPPSVATPAKAGEPAPAPAPAANAPKASPEQLSKIEKLFDLTKSDVDKFCATFKVTSFSALTTDQADKAISILKAKAEKMMAEAGKEAVPA
jgi:hypothetical protein